MDIKEEESRIHLPINLEVQVDGFKVNENYKIWLSEQEENE